VPDPIDPLDAPAALQPDGAEAPPPGSGKSPAGVPLWMLGAAVCGFGALCLMVGLRVGKAVGSAQLAPPSVVEKITVHECEKCKQKAPAVSREAVEAMLAQQREVSDAA
jgi:hypothetical protein